MFLEVSATIDENKAPANISFEAELPLVVSSKESEPTAPNASTLSQEDDIDTVIFDLVTREEMRVPKDKLEESEETLAPLPLFEGLDSLKVVSDTSLPLDLISTPLGKKKEPDGIIGDTDDRVRITPTTSFPWRTICRLVVTDGDGSLSLGSGAIIDEFHVLTAAHVVYDHDTGGWPLSVKVIPAQDNETMPYGYAWATIIRTYRAWTDKEKKNHDWAVLTLDRNVGRFTGWMGRMTSTLGDPVYLGNLNLAGYPGDKDPGRARLMYWDADSGFAASQYRHYYDMDAYKGQSGGPVWVFYSDTGNRYILSINAYMGKYHNWGVRLNRDKYDRLNSWVGSDTPPTDYADLVDYGSGFSPTTVQPGVTSFDVYCRIRNIGTAGSGAFHVSYYASTDMDIAPSDYLICSVSVPPIPSFAFCDFTRTVTFPGSVPEDSTYYVGWIIDSDYEIAEFDEDNNKAIAPDLLATIDDDTTPPTYSGPSSGPSVLNDSFASYYMQATFAVHWSDPSGISEVHFRFWNDSTYIGWFLPTSSSTDANGNGWYYYSMPRSQWINYVGQTIYWKSVAWDNDNDRPLDRAGPAETSKMAGPQIEDDDSTPPTLTDPACTLDSFNRYKLEITVTDPSGVYQVLFRYKFDAGTWTDWQAASGGSGDEFWYNVQQSEWMGHITLYWQVFSKDNDNDRTDDRASVTSPTYYCTLIIYYIVHLATQHDTDENVNLGTITFNGARYGLPYDLLRTAGSYLAEYHPDSGYMFVRWETAGGVGVENDMEVSTTVTISSAGILRAIYSEEIPTLPFEDGFELGDFSRWSGTSVSPGENAEVVDKRPHQGVYSAFFTSKGDSGNEWAYCYKNVPSVGELYARGYFYVDTSGISDDGDAFYFIGFSAGGEALAFAGWKQIGGAVGADIRWNLMARDGTGWVSNDSSTSPLMGQWYCIELHWVEGDVDGYAELWVDGILVCSILGKDTAAFGDVDCVQFGLASTVNCGVTWVFGDCAVISETYIGPKELPAHDLARDAEENT